MSEPWESHKHRLRALEKLPFNLDLARREEYTRQAGWRIDDYEALLPAELPGLPLENGSFQAAQSILRDYRFPPPDLITGIFYPNQPLQERIMLLRGRFLGFSFYFGVRVTGVIDELRETPSGKERVWGYSYATLEQHFEQGQIEFSIVKQLQSGAVRFKVHAFSRTGVIRNPFYRIGFRIFGRYLQRRFAQDSLRRMQQLVLEKLQTGALQSPTVPVQAAAADPKADARLEDLSQVD